MISYFRFGLSINVLRRTLSCSCESYNPHGKAYFLPICSFQLTLWFVTYVSCLYSSDSNSTCNQSYEWPGLEVRKFPKQWQHLQDNTLQNWTKRYIAPIRILAISNWYGSQSTAIICVHSFASLCSSISKPRVANPTFHICLCYGSIRSTSQTSKGIHHHVVQLYHGHPSLLPRIFSVFCPHGM